MNKEKRKHILKVSARQIGISLLIYALILIFHLRYIGIMLLLTVLVLLGYSKRLLTADYRTVTARQTRKELSKSLLTTYIIVTIIYLLSWILGPYGFYGSLLIVFFIAAYKIVIKRREFMEGVREIETEIWGRPLDRKYWKDHRPPKIRLAIRKKNLTGDSMKHKQKNKPKAPLPPALCWVSLAAFVIIGALSVTNSLLTALVAINSGVGVLYFIGYLLGLLCIVWLAYIFPVIMMATYLRQSRKYHATK